MPNVIRPCFGLEQESALSLLDERSRRLRSVLVLQKFMTIASERYPHLPARDSSGIFLGNGGRLYIDCGKPEITTPEVTNPTDACRYSRAGEVILWDVAQALMQRVDRARRVMMTRSNVSYGGSANAWACHESYGHRCQSLTAEDFIPHAVSRIVYTGAGGFSNRTRAIQFLISPRVVHLSCSISENTQRGRGIFNTKDEPLNRCGYGRLHVICGESTSSILSQWLKMATTATVVAMAEAGMAPGRDLQLVDPVRAIRDFAQDATLTTAAPLECGKHVTALDMQRKLLARAQQLDVAGPLNDWLPACLQLWEQTLDRLQQGREAVQRTLDWAIKLELFRNHVQRRGLTWEQLMHWNKVLVELDEHLLADEDDCTRLTNQEFVQSTRSLRDDPAIRRALPDDAKWDDLEQILQVRDELYEIDTRFGEFGPSGIFNALDAQGLLDHHVQGVDDVARAVTDPPDTGRAHLRGCAIKKMSSDGIPGACEWSHLWDYRSSQILDLSDPFASETCWKSADETTDWKARRGLGCEHAFQQALALYDRGQYETAYRMVRSAVRWLHAYGSMAAVDCQRLGALIQAHRGHTDGASWLRRCYPDGPEGLGQLGDYLLVFRFQGLVPRAELGLWCERGFRFLEENPDSHFADIVTLRTCYGYYLLTKGLLTQAWEAYHDGIDPQWLAALHRRVYAHICTEKADLLRQLDRHEEALRLLDEAHDVHVQENFSGDHADLTLAQRAKVLAQTGHVAAAQECVNKALRIQRDAANVVGEVRSLLLLARLSGMQRHQQPVAAEVRERIVTVVSDRPALFECNTTQRILAKWEP